MSHENTQQQSVGEQNLITLIADVATLKGKVENMENLSQTTVELANQTGQLTVLVQGLKETIQEDKKERAQTKIALTCAIISSVTAVGVAVFTIVF